MDTLGCRTTNIWWGKLSIFLRLSKYFLQVYSNWPGTKQNEETMKTGQKSDYIIIPDDTSNRNLSMFFTVTYSYPPVMWQWKHLIYRWFSMIFSHITFSCKGFPSSPPWIPSWGFWTFQSHETSHPHDPMKQIPIKQQIYLFVKSMLVKQFHKKIG